MASFSSTTQPTPFGIFDDDLHFQEDADGMILYVKRRLGDDIMSVELTNRQIWTNFEEATLEFSKNVNAHQAESYMSNLLGLSTGPTVSYKKNTFVMFANNSANAIHGVTPRANATLHRRSVNIIAEYSRRSNKSMYSVQEIK